MATKSGTPDSKKKASKSRKTLKKQSAAPYALKADEPAPDDDGKGKDGEHEGKAKAKAHDEAEKAAKAKAHEEAEKAAKAKAHDEAEKAAKAKAHDEAAAKADDEAAAKADAKADAEAAEAAAKADAQAAPAAKASDEPATEAAEDDVEALLAADEIELGRDPNTSAPPPKKAPPGDSRSMRRAHDGKQEFVLIYRIESFLITRTGEVGKLGSFTRTEYPSIGSAAHAYAQQCSNLTGAGYADVR